MAVTIKDIAKRAGVSHSTVSRALRDDPLVAEETASRIRRLASELSYVPSAAARSLKTSRSRVLGVIVNRIADPFYSEVLDGVQEVFQTAGYSLFLGSPNHDDRHGAKQLTEHLLELGHRQIAFLGNVRGGRLTQERLSGYREALFEADLMVPGEYVAMASSGEPTGGAEGMRSLLDRELPPTAVVCYNDMMAFGAMQVIRESGLTVPADLSVVGFDDIELSAYFSPALTTFHQPKYQLGSEAARMMLRQLNGAFEGRDVEQAESITVRGELRIRSSTAPPLRRERKRIRNQHE
ncbi:MAG: LacI family DNA-binding transcriptional regulator [Chloroflexi bacterium]|nr:LacI family DNA-binding transcriptional regulator [Chloroflexota bacterium]